MKKLFVLMVAMVMMCLAIAVAALPSKTSDDVATVGKIIADGDENKECKLSIIIVEDEMVDETLAEIAEAVKDKAPIEFFPEELQKDIGEKLGEDADPKVLELNEFVALDVLNYEPDTYTYVTAAFTFATEYKADQKALPVLGFYDQGDEVDWVALNEAEIQEDGSVSISFEDALLARMDASPSIAMAILSTPAAD